VLLTTASSTGLTKRPILSGVGRFLLHHARVGNESFLRGDSFPAVNWGPLRYLQPTPGLAAVKQGSVSALSVLARLLAVV